MPSKQELEKRIADLEARQDLLIEVIFALAEKVEPDAAHFALLALTYGFRANDMEALQDFYGWALTQEPGALMRDDVAREFARRLPHHESRLESLMRAHQDDDNFAGLCRVVLGSGLAEADSAAGHPRKRGKQDKGD